MFRRQLDLTTRESFFLFGARGTGKSTLLRSHFSKGNVVWVDLLDPGTEDELVRRPQSLAEKLKAMPKKPSVVVIDEIQKVPKLLDVVQHLIDTRRIRFALTGSSARKLKAGGANLLAGRAFNFELFPLTHQELGPKFSLSDALAWGTLPKIAALKSDMARARFLQAYTQNYLKEEIWGEHLVRKLEPFRRFVEVAAQANGKIVNYARIAADVLADEKTVKTYFEVIEETLLGYQLESFHHSFRKRLSSHPKFYFFDLGVARSLARRLSVPLVEGTYDFGNAFEQFVIVEALRLHRYNFREYRFSYLRTNADAEVDLVIERPAKKVALVEIKSATQPTDADVSTVARLAKDMGNAEAYCLCRVETAREINGVRVFPWHQGLRELFG